MTETTPAATPHRAHHGKEVQHHRLSQGDINVLLVQKTQEGKIVGRHKGSYTVIGAGVSLHEHLD